MKVSEITVQNVVDFLRLETGEYDNGYITSILSSAKAFIRSYTGITEEDITGETVGSGDGEATSFKLANHGIALDTLSVYVNGAKRTKDTDYKYNLQNGTVRFVAAPEKDASITADYKSGLDGYEEFVHVVYILCQDMFDNRSLEVDKSNVNRVYQSILDMHSVNLL